jgi:hypothetical protein
MVGFNMYSVKPHRWSKFWVRMLTNILTVDFSGRLDLSCPLIADKWIRYHFNFILGLSSFNCYSCRYIDCSIATNV